jgi:hypothetical protein
MSAAVSDSYKKAAGILEKDLRTGVDGVVVKHVSDHDGKILRNAICLEYRAANRDAVVRILENARMKSADGGLEKFVAGYEDWASAESRGLTTCSAIGQKKQKPGQKKASLYVRLGINERHAGNRGRIDVLRNIRNNFAGAAVMPRGRSRLLVKNVIGATIGDLQRIAPCVR